MLLATLIQVEINSNRMNELKTILPNLFGKKKTQEKKMVKKKKKKLEPKKEEKEEIQRLEKPRRN